MTAVRVGEGPLSNGSHLQVFSGEDDDRVAASLVRGMPEGRHEPAKGLGAVSDTRPQEVFTLRPLASSMVASRLAGQDQGGLLYGLSRRFATWTQVQLIVVVLALAACPAAAAQAPTITTPPVISPTSPLEGHVLTATPGEWSPAAATAAYQWLRCGADGSDCADIEGATGLTYQVGPADLERTLVVRVTVTMAPTGATDVARSPPTELVPRPPSNSGPPKVTGTARDGQVLTASAGQWIGTPPLHFDYQWERCLASRAGCRPIPGAASESYVLVSADVGMTLRVAVTASNRAGTSPPAQSDRTVVVAPPPLLSLEPPTIIGAAEVGRALSATPGRWEPGGQIDFLYRWLRCQADRSECAAVPGATSAVYEVRPLDVGFRLRVRVTAISDSGSFTSESALTAVVPAPPAAQALPQGGSFPPAASPVTPVEPAYMRPFPGVRIRGYYTSRGAVLQLVLVTAPRGVRIAVSCRRKGCPFRDRVWRPASRRLRLRALERAFPAGTRLEIRITARRRIGKYARIVIRAGRPPVRRDRCLMPGRARPVACVPSS